MQPISFINLNKANFCSPKNLHFSGIKGLNCDTFQTQSENSKKKKTHLQLINNAYKIYKEQGYKSAMRYLSKHKFQYENFDIYIESLEKLLSDDKFKDYDNETLTRFAFCYNNLVFHSHILNDDELLNACDLIVKKLKDYPISQYRHSLISLFFPVIKYKDEDLSKYLQLLSDSGFCKIFSSDEFSFNNYDYDYDENIEDKMREFLSFTDWAVKLDEKEFDSFLNSINSDDCKNYSDILKIKDDICANKIFKQYGITEQDDNDLESLKNQAIDLFNKNIAPLYDKNPDMTNCFLLPVSEIIERIKLADDSNILKYIIQKLNSIDKNTNILECCVNASEALLLLDAINSFNQKYSVLYNKDKHSNSNIFNLILFLNNKGIKFSDITREKLKELAPCVDYNTFLDDIDKESRIYSIKEYIKKYSKSPMSDYLYALYLKSCYDSGEYNFENIALCFDISKKFGSRVFPMSIKSHPDENQWPNNKINFDLKLLFSEFINWKKAGKDKAKIPPVVDFSTCYSNWFIDDESKSHAVGFSEAYDSGSISVLEPEHYVYRHEIAHTNQNNSLTCSLLADLILMTHKKLIKKELKKAGLSDFSVEYALSNPCECVAKASEGDFSKYSSYFKLLLKQIGMPKWILDLPSLSGDETI